MFLKTKDTRFRIVIAILLIIVVILINMLMSINKENKELLLMSDKNLNEIYVNTKNYINEYMEYIDSTRDFNKTTIMKLLNQDTVPIEDRMMIDKLNNENAKLNEKYLSLSNLKFIKSKKEFLLKVIDFNHAELVKKKNELIHKDE